MQRIYTLIFVMAFTALSLSAQIILGPDHLIAAGFSMTLFIDSDFDDPQGNLARVGADQTWDFSQGLDINDTTLVEARLASFGNAADSFPDAELVFTTEQEAGFVTASSEVYLDRVGNDLEIIGIADADPAAVLPTIRLTDPLLFQSTPLTFLSTTSDQTRLRLTFGPEILTVFTGDSTFNNFIDSVGLSIGQDVDTNVDSWGTISLNGQTYDALRISTVTQAFQEIEVLVPFLGWVPITSQIPGIDSTIDFNNQRTETFTWEVAEFSFPIMQVAVDSNGQAETATFMADPALSTREQAPQVGITAFAQNNTLDITLVSSELSGQGEVKVYGANGAVIEQRNIQLRDDRIKFNTSAWPSGIQLITVWSRGKLVGTQKVFVQ